MSYNLYDVQAKVYYQGNQTESDINTLEIGKKVSDKVDKPNLKFEITTVKMGLR